VQQGRIRTLRQCFDLADFDDDDELDRDELDTLVVALNPREITKANRDLLWEILKPQGKEHLSWLDFLEGVARVRRDEKARLMLNLTHPNQFALVSLLVDIKIGKEEQEVMESGLSFFDKRGVETFKFQLSQQKQDQYNLLLKKASEGALHKVGGPAAKHIVHHERMVGCAAFLTGLIMNLIPAAWETFTKVELQSDGIADLFYTCNNMSSFEVPADDVVVQECPMSSAGKVVLFSCSVILGNAV
jgi:hypothetical protein